LYILETKRAKCSPYAAVCFAVSMVKELLITEREALMRIDPHQMAYFMRDLLDPTPCINGRSSSVGNHSSNAKRVVLGKGIAASPGAAIGKVAFSTEQVQEYHAKQEACILVKAETTAEDVAALKVSLRLSDRLCVLTSELMIPCVLLPRTRSL
jgi:pyruvate,orthophosphate dikinase